MFSITYIRMKQKSLTRKYPHHKDLIMNEVESNNFEGSYNESLTFNLVLDEQNTRITILGLGDKKELSNEKFLEYLLLLLTS